MSPRPKFSDIDDYLASASPQAKPILEEIRRLVKRTVPEARERISYQIPCFRLRRNFIYFAAFKHHIGIFPPLAGGTDLDEALRPYRGAKGNLRFPLDEPMPYELIERLVQALARQSEGGPEASEG